MGYTHGACQNSDVNFGAAFIALCGSQDHGKIQAGRDLKGSSVQPPAQSRVSCEIRPDWSVLIQSHL